MLIRILALLATLAAAFSPAHAQPVDDFYRARTVTLIISFAPGGLNDFTGRLLARHIGRFVPGHPSVVVQNMGGAGGLVAANHLYTIAARDGSVIGQLDRSVPQSGLRGAANARFDVARFTLNPAVGRFRGARSGSHSQL